MPLVECGGKLVLRTRASRGGRFVGGVVLRVAMVVLIGHGCVVRESVR